MKNIVFLNSNKLWGGGEKWHLNMALALSKKGYKTSLITNSASELRDRAEKESLELTSIKISPLSFINPLKLLTLYYLLLKLKPDAIFLNLPSDVKIVTILAPFLKIKKIIYRRGMPNPIRNTFLNRFFYSKVDIIIANSLEIQKSIIKNIPSLKKKTRVVYNGVSPQDLLKKDIPSPPIRLGNLGRLVEQKGQKHLIAVAKHLKNQNFSFTLTIAGKGPLKEVLEFEVKREGLEKEVQLIGHTQADFFFKSIDIFLFTSHFEGSANALIESLQYHVPPIAFDISSNSEVVEEEKTGYLIPAFNEIEMAKKVIFLASTPKKYSELQRNASTAIKNKFDYTKKVEEIEKIIHE